MTELKPFTTTVKLPFSPCEQLERRIRDYIQELQNPTELSAWLLNSHVVADRLERILKGEPDE